jgi:hypothetical protein
VPTYTALKVDYQLQTMRVDFFAVKTIFAPYHNALCQYIFYSDFIKIGVYIKGVPSYLDFRTYIY